MGEGASLCWDYSGDVRRVLTAHVVFVNADSKLGGSNVICLCCCYHLVVELKGNSG
jgi:hypothetical protein